MANTTTTTNKKDEIKELKEQLKKQQEQIDALLAKEQSNIEKVDVPVETVSDIGSDDEVLVISLVPNKLNMLDRDGRVIFAFNDMYDEQYVDFASLRECVNSHRDMALNGRFYIADERAVNKLRLKSAYRNILSPKQFEDIVKNNINTAVDLYKIAPTGQQKVIVDIIKEKKMKGVDMDMNMLHKLSDLSGSDLVNVEDVMSIKTK